MNRRRKTKTASSNDVHGGTPGSFEECSICRRESQLADTHEGHEHPRETLVFNLQRSNIRGMEVSSMLNIAGYVPNMSININTSRSTSIPRLNTEPQEEHSTDEERQKSRFGLLTLLF